MTDLNSTGDDERVDLLIDRAVAWRVAGSAADDQALADLSPDAALIARLCRLSEIDWPADEVADRIAGNVAAAAGQLGSTVHSTTSRSGRPGRRSRARQSHQRSGTARWLAVAAAAAVVLAAVGVVLTGHSPTATRHSAAAKTTHPATSPAATATPAAPQTWLTAMRIVSRPRSLRAIGTASISNNFLTCVTRSVCYTLGSLSGGNADIARSVDGGATWTSGGPLPSANGSFDSQVKASCPRALTCFLPWGTDLLETSDGFAHSQLLPVTMPSGASEQVSKVSCPTTQHCVAAVNLSSSSQPFIYSDNGGVSWTAARSPAVSVDDIIGGLRCNPGGACLAAVLVGTEQNPLVAALSSTDGGRSWTMSPTRSIVDMQQYMVSCADGRDCVVGSNDGYLAFIKADRGGHISIRIQAPRSSWTANTPASTMTVYDVSCATGNDCFVDLGSAQLAATRDGGFTWTSAPLDPNLPQDNVVYLSCPVAAGCIGLANNGSGNQTSWAVLSDIRNGG